MITTDAKDLYDKGYGDLVTIIPPDGIISPLSKIPAEQRGKVPGRHTPGGWVGYNWRAAPEVHQQDVDEWGVAGVGIRSDYFPAVDIDVLDPTLSSLLQQIAIAELGLAPLRIGRAPKALLMFRTREPFKRVRLWIGDNHLVEVLGAGQQFVAGGVHPGTGKPYSWDTVPEADDLTEITAADVDRFIAAAQDACELLGYTCRIEGGAFALADRNAIDQDALIADDADRVAEAVRLIPNTNELFAGRNDYLRMGYAIKGALGEAGLPLFVEWAEKWEGNGNSAGNTEESATADWRRMRPPFEVGAPYIFELAQNFGFNTASDEFEVGDSDADPLAEPTGPIMYSDAACAHQFIREYGDQHRYVAERSAWLGWEGGKWALGDGASAEWAAAGMLNTLSNRALRSLSPPMKAEGMATKLASVSMRGNVVRYASAAPGMRVNMDQLDADPYLLNTPDGVYDLRDGSRRDADPALLMTRSTAVAPEFAPAERWAEFLDEATAGDKDLQRYLQRLTGYAVTGLKTEHNLAFIYGPGGNGKGVFLNTVQAILADYAKAANMDTFTASKFDKHPTDMAGLAGSRLVTAQETQEGRSWDEAKVKMLTSSDKVQARFMREDFFEFEPTFKLIFAGNHKPEIRNLDDAMKRRFHLVPFTVKPKRVNPMLSEQLREEWPRILAWMIEGTKAWLAEGLNPPAVVLEATAEYFDEEDPIGQWIRERVDRSDTTAEFLSSTDVYDNWREWAGENGEYGRNVKTLVRELKGRGFRAARTATARGFTGVRFLAGPGAADYAGSDFV